MVRDSLTRIDHWSALPAGVVVEKSLAAGMALQHEFNRTGYIFVTNDQFKVKNDFRLNFEPVFKNTNEIKPRIDSTNSSVVVNNG